MYRYIILFLSLLSAQAIFSQKELDIHQRQAKQAVLDFFEGFHKGDTAQIRNTIDHQMFMQTVTKTKDGDIKTIKTTINEFLTVIHNRPADQKWLEKLLNFEIVANENIAQIWTPYEFYVNDQFSHCGVNVFQLYHDGKTWRIMAIADTRKRKGCN